MIGHDTHMAISSSSYRESPKSPQICTKSTSYVPSKSLSRLDGWTTQSPPHDSPPPQTDGRDQPLALVVYALVCLLFLAFAIYQLHDIFQARRACLSVEGGTK